MQIPGLTLAILLACPAFAQAPAQAAPPRAEFEVASIKLFDRSVQGQLLAGLHVDGAQIRAVGLTLRDLLGIAYQIKATLISGPDSTSSEQFDVSATLPAGSTRAQLPEMFQALLADRFQVKVHRDKKDFAVYALLVGKGGLKMKETPPDPNDKGDDGPRGNVETTRTGNGATVNFGRGTSFTLANNRFEARKMSMALFAGNLERFADRQIVDMTGLTAQYDFAFDVTPEEYMAMQLRAAVWVGAVLPPEAQKMLDASSPAALGDALQQIGLRLDARKAPLDVLVIDDALRTPTAN
ncbi:MAG TPA: TIGR03435 family protein [Bryobacteraceae bacterium]